MAVHSTILRGALQLADAAKTGDMRRHRRLPLALRGRFMRADRNEYTCALKNISVGGAAIVTQQIPEVGERVVVYLEQLGGLEGTVARTTPDGFAFVFKVTEHKREKLAAQIMWLVNRDDFPDETERVARTRGNPRPENDVEGRRRRHYRRRIARSFGIWCIDWHAGTAAHRKLRGSRQDPGDRSASSRTRHWTSVSRTAFARSVA